MTHQLDAGAAAARFKLQIREELAKLPEPLVLLGVLAAEGGPSATYAEYARKACEDVGMQFRLERATRLDVQAIVQAANRDPNVHGIMVYYPVFGTQQDSYLRDTVEPAKDVEGLHSFWARCLHENRRFVDAAHTKKAILPCTPLAIIKMIEAAGASAPAGRPLEGRTAVVFNRSEVVGRPLASMLAHDGAQVYSFDVDGPLLFTPSSAPDGAHRVSETAVTRGEALQDADLVITGVPSKQFARIGASEIRHGAVCINFSTFQNFDSDIIGKAFAFAPRVGPMTVTMALRNALRLRSNAL